VAAAVACLSLFAIALIWAVGLSVASYISRHPEEVGCFFVPTCNAAYSGDRETITNVQRGQKDLSLVIVDVKLINHARTSAAVDSGDYLLRTSGSGSLKPSSDCPLPGPATVPAGGRLEQRVCFRIPDPNAAFDLRLPWTGWDYRTGPTPVPSPSP
jgi:hypothetical protein